MNNFNKNPLNDYGAHDYYGAGDSRSLDSGAMRPLSFVFSLISPKWLTFQAYELRHAYSWLTYKSAIKKSGIIFHLLSRSTTQFACKPALISDWVILPRHLISSYPSTVLSGHEADHCSYYQLQWLSHLYWIYFRDWKIMILIMFIKKVCP